MTTRHLDLGCGTTPRNPYRCDELYTVDLARPEGVAAEYFRSANLSLEPIPYEDAMFDSVSAYDFLEHVPRVLNTADGRGTRFPFVEVMNQVHRVLRPGGRLYALTPCWPRHESMTDPTHVNIITEHTHRYFTDDPPAARIYGFSGRFKCLRSAWVRKRRTEYIVPGADPLRRFFDALLRRRAHLLWELEALK
jgi:SAM-dependent methyltransferase